MVIPHMNQKSEIHVGLSWSEGSGKYNLSKVIELAPRFFIYNKLSQAIRFREVAAPPTGPSEINPGERAPLHFMRIEQRRLLTVAYSGLDAQWYRTPCFFRNARTYTHLYVRSVPIDMEAIGTTHARMYPPGFKDRDDAHLINVDVILQKATVFVALSHHEGPWPFVIDNKSSYDVSVGQVVSCTLTSTYCEI